MSLLYIIIIGGIAGWLANTLVKGKSKGLVMNVLIGVVGAFVGPFVFDLLNVQIGGGALGLIITATVGAVIVLFVARLIAK
jgi:uncharacterized membrane protein YeaQ/YmgE (transglycosylase-associated protein family)